jgi:hypothetical protein
MIKADCAAASCPIPSDASTANDRHKCAPLLDVFVSIAATDGVALQSVKQTRRRIKKDCKKTKRESLVEKKRRRR